MLARRVSEGGSRAGNGSTTLEIGPARRPKA